MSDDLRAAPSCANIADYLAEAAGTALLVFVGIGWVTLLISPASPLPALLPPAWLRRGIAGGLFGLTGTAITLSPLGRRSGAHINPAVTFAFWLERQISSANAAFYVAAQVAGACLGARALLVWGRWGQELHFGLTQPAPVLPAWAAAGLEAAITWLMVTLILVMVARPVTRPYTAWIMGPLFAVLVAVEAPLTGTSANPARSLGPAWVTGDWHDVWVYVLGPLAGALVAVALVKLEVWGSARAREARLAHFRLA